MTAKKKRTVDRTASSEDESRADVNVKTPKSSKKQKVNQEKETRKGIKVMHFINILHTHNNLWLILMIYFMVFNLISIDFCFLIL